jgi:uncharacterized LabA/DUF88 family protein
MASFNDNVSMALFCDFENVALGVRDANYEKFDIKPVLERLLLKGSITVKKAYCDWDRYKAFKGPMHEANFELIEIPHVRISGKNSADIRMVVDALDLCYTKAHVNTFVIISGDSDFSPLVSKLRENNKKVIGVGVKDSTSDLLVANCDEFIFYDDLVREKSRNAKRDSREQPPKRSPEEEKRKRDEMDKRRNQAVDIAYETFDALVAERGDSGKIWASVLKEAIKRRKPDFSESFYGFRTFGNLLEEMKARGLLEFGRDEKSGAYVYRSSTGPVQAAATEAAPDTEQAGGEQPAVETAEAPRESREAREAREGRRGRGNRGGRNRRGGAPEPVEPVEQSSAPMSDVETQEVAVALETAAADYAALVRSTEQALQELAPEEDAHGTTAEQEALAADETPAVAADVEASAETTAKRPRSPRKPAAAKKPARTSKVAKAAADAAEAVEAVLAQAPAPEPVAVAEAAPADAGEAAPAEGAKRPKKPGTHKTPARSRLPRKPKAKPEE